MHHFFLLVVAFSGLVYSSPSSIEKDTLSLNETLSHGHTLISRNRTFELGFFSPASSPNNTFLGIWYAETPDVVVWVANRNNPIRGSQGVIFEVEGDRASVVTTRDGSIIWLWNISSMVMAAASNPILCLLDTGNLVLTRLPGMFMVQSLDAEQDKYLTSWRSSDDPSPGDFAFVESQVKRCLQAALLCVQKNAEDRPAMTSIVSMLGCDVEAVSEPREPGFFMERSSNNVENNTSRRKESVRETITITELEGR